MKIHMSKAVGGRRSRAVQSLCMISGVHITTVCRRACRLITRAPPRPDIPYCHNFPGRAPDWLAVCATVVPTVAPGCHGLWLLRTIIDAKCTRATRSQRCILRHKCSTCRERQPCVLRMRNYCTESGLSQVFSLSGAVCGTSESSISYLTLPQPIF